MMRQSSSRSQRSKGGFRLKHALQICLLLAICTWLVYQVKHSHDKKRAFEERITMVSAKVAEEQQEIFNFGRKGLPLVKDNDLKTMAHSKEEDSEEGQGEEVEQEQDVKHDENEEEEVKREGEDGIDELDQDRGDDESDQEEEGQFMDDEEKDGQVDEDSSFDNEEREDSAQEAREENYKRDDVSSAVTHDVHPGETDAKGLDEEQENEAVKTDNLGADDSKNSKNTSLEHVASMNNASYVAIGENRTVANVDVLVNGSSLGTEGSKVEYMKSENRSISTPLSNEDSNQKAVQSNTTIAALAEKNLEVTSISGAYSPPEYQNSPKLDDGSAGSTSMEGLVGHNMKSHPNEAQNPEIHTQNSTIKAARTLEEQTEARTELPTLPIIKDNIKEGEGKAVE